VRRRHGRTGITLAGQHTPDAEDTVLDFLTKDETVLKTLRAAGGRGVNSAASNLPDGVSELSASDIDGGFHITTLMAVNLRNTETVLCSSWGVTGNALLCPAFPSTQCGMWSAQRDGARLSGQFHEGYSFR